MGIAVVFRMYAEDGTFVSPAMGEVFELPEIESVHWRGDTPYTVRSVSDDALPAINLVFDVQRSRVLEDLLPDGSVAEVWRSADRVVAMPSSRIRRIRRGPIHLERSTVT